MKHHISGIYQIKCKTNNKIYIGSSVNIKQRWKYHKWQLRAGKHDAKYMQNCWNKYGEEDFVFSILAEELGMFGALCTVALFVMVTLRGLIIGLRAEREKLFFSAYVAYGLSILWIGQFIINIGVNIGLLPTKGLTLPFLSYGGSSLIICCVSLALLLRIDWERRNALGNAEIEFSESDFFDEEKKHGA